MALTPAEHSQKLIRFLAAIDSPDDEVRKEAKLQLINHCAELMPQGKPNYAILRNYRPLPALINQFGRKCITKAVFMLVKQFCGSLNLVRNMNEDQMIEAAAMLVEEAGTFRLEDYLVMFAMAKKGELGKILDRMDIQVIMTMLDEYWRRRNEAGKRLQEEVSTQPLAQLSSPPADPAKVSAALRSFIDEFAKKRQDEEKEEIYRLEKIRQRQRDVLKNNQNNEK